MNKIDRPTFFDDHMALTALSNNKLVGSHPSLLPHVPAIREGYTAYVIARGDARAITGVPLPLEIETALKGHYASPPSDIAYIDVLRDQGGAKTCPMCGSLHGGTLDHILPKTNFPSFAIFGLNLVPACKCNSLRSVALVGPAPGERILHPYFDDVLGQRLMGAKFEDLGAVPRVSVRLLLDPAHASYPGVLFHFQNVVEKTQIVDWQRNLWSKLMRRPGMVVRDLRINPQSRAHLVDILNEERDTLDEARESKNNWDSVFIAGLLDDPVVDWLYAQFGRPGRLPNGELATA
ncbi:MAG: HNH endonuclease [Sphingopyxis sp.]